MLLSACSSTDPYRNEKGGCESESLKHCEKHAVSIHNSNSGSEFYLGFIEFNDQGQFSDLNQESEVMELVNWAIAPNIRNIFSRSFINMETLESIIFRDVIFVVYVHGWHHNAAQGDENVESFKKLLAKISIKETFESEQEEREKRKVVGIYMGWRGDSIRIPWLNYATFWERKNTAHKIGTQGASEFLLRLEAFFDFKSIFNDAIEATISINEKERIEIMKGIKEAFLAEANMDETRHLRDRLNKSEINVQRNESRKSESQLVVIGHSFGAAVVYSAIRQLLLYRNTRAPFWPVSTDQIKSTTDTLGFGSLVILMNPAIEAMRFSNLHILYQSSCQSYYQLALPRLVILTSESDLATSFGFPTGRKFSTLFESYSEKLPHTVCTAKTYEFGEPKWIKEESADKTAIGHFDPYRTHILTQVPTNSSKPIDDFRILREKWDSQIFGGHMDFNNVRLVHLGRTDPSNPFLNILVERSFISDHNKIWGDKIMDFISDLVTISTAVQKDKVKK